MKILTLLTLTFCISIISYGQQAKFETLWAKHIIRSAPMAGNTPTVKADAQKNVYVLANFDTLEVDTLYLTSATKKSSVVLKFDSLGNLTWAFIMIDKAPNVTSTDMMVDQAGNIYITGYYEGEFQITPTIKLDSFSYGAMFFAKLDAGGNVLWAKGYNSGSATLFSVGHNKVGLKTESSGLPYMLGDSLIDLVPSNGMAVFDADGNTLAVKVVPRWGFSSQWAFAADGIGNIFSVMLLKDDSLVLDGTVIKKADLTKTAYVIVGMDENLDVKWTKVWEGVAEKKYGVSINDRDLIADNAGNLYVLKAFSDTFEVEGKQVIAKDGLNFFVGKVNNNGVVQWLKQSDSPQGNQSGKIQGLNNNKLYISAAHDWGTISFDDFENISSPATVVLNTGNGKAFAASRRINDAGFNTVGGTAQFALAMLFASSSYTIKGVNYTQNRPHDLLLIMQDSTQSTGIAKGKKPGIGISVYPNPAQTAITIGTEGLKPGTAQQITITDVAGKVVLALNNRTVAPQTTIDVTALPAGVYFLKLQDGQGNTAAQKFIIQR